MDGEDMLPGLNLNPKIFDPKKIVVFDDWVFNIQDHDMGLYRYDIGNGGKLVNPKKIAMLPHAAISLDIEDDNIVVTDQFRKTYYDMDGDNPKEDIEL